jgi:hypothetical protein
MLMVGTFAPQIIKYPARRKHIAQSRAVFQPYLAAAQSTAGKQRKCAVFLPPEGLFRRLGVFHLL